MTSETDADRSTQSLADLIRGLRRERDLTQEALAEASGLSTRLISDLERGLILRPRRDTVQMLADGFSLSGPERDEFVLFARRGPSAEIDTGQQITPSPPLPASPNALIGRSREFADLTSLLSRSDIRMITLIGPGGVGKTRMALEIGRSVVDQFAGGAGFIELASVTSADRITGAIARHFGVSTDDQTALDALTIATLNEVPRLLILDNLEQIPGAGPWVANLLERCPELKVMVTSRVVLRIRAEQIFQIDPLATPNPRTLPTAVELAAVPSVSLLINRAQSARHTFAITDENAVAVAEIVTRLDGLPLAIELAAARLRVMSAADLLARIDPPLPILTRGPADLPERLQTMRAAIGWSYALLDSREQQLLRWLALYTGGFTFAAAEETATAVLNARKDARHPSDLVASLVEKSLIQPIDQPGADDRSDAFRFRMLETIREFSLEMLRESGERDQARTTHANAIARFAIEAGDGLSSPEQHYWYDALDTDLDNIRVALQSAIDLHDADPAHRIGGSIYRFWANRGMIVEASDWYRQILALPVDAPNRYLGDCHLGAGVMTYFQGNLEGAESQTRDAQTVYMEAGWELGVAYSYGNLGMIADAGGDAEAAVSLYNHALGMFRRLGDEISEGYMLGNLALVLMDAGDLDGSEALNLQALDHYRRLQNEESAAYCLSSLGEIAQLRGDLATAEPFHRESMEIRARFGHQTGIAKQLECYAEMACATGQDERAARLYGAAARIRQDIGNPNEPRFVAEFEKQSTEMRSRIGPERFSAAWESGISLTTEEAIELALK